MKKSAFLRVGALVIGSASLGLVPLVSAPARAQPLPVERAMPIVSNLSLKQVAPDEAERLAMPNKPIVLRLSDVTLSRALSELQKQSGVEFEFGGADKKILDKTLSIDLETRFFMPAFEAILDEAGVKASLQRYGRREVYNVQFGQTDRDKTAPMLSGVGPFQVGLQSVDSNFRQTMTMSADGAPKRSEKRSFSFTFKSTPDPVVDVIGSPLIILKRVEDEKGRSLLDANAQQWLRYDFNDIGSYGRQTAFQMPASDAKKLARVEGIAMFVVPSGSQRWEIADVLESKDLTHEFESEGRTFLVKIKSAQLDGNAVNVYLEMTAPGGNNREENRSPLFSFGMMSRAFTLHDANGKILRANGYSGSGSSGKMDMRSTFTLSSDSGRRFAAGVVLEDETPVIAAPMKLVFDAPTEFAQTEVPFSFTDVPLP